MNAAAESVEASGAADPDPVSENNAAWPGYEKFGTVQDILDQNK